MKLFSRLFLFLFLVAPTFAQDWIRTGTGLGVEKVRLDLVQPEAVAINQTPGASE